jgi:hypothetical protein
MPLDFSKFASFVYLKAEVDGWAFDFISSLTGAWRFEMDLHIEVLDVVEAPLSWVEGIGLVLGAGAIGLGIGLAIT